MYLANYGPRGGETTRPRPKIDPQGQGQDLDPQGQGQGQGLNPQGQGQGLRIWPQAKAKAKA